MAGDPVFGTSEVWATCDTGCWAWALRLLRLMSHHTKNPMRARPTTPPMTGPAIQAWLEEEEGGGGGEVEVVEVVEVMVEELEVVVVAPDVIGGGFR
jgi:hypothetical protein